MLTTLWIRIAELTLTLLLAACVIFAWREARNDRAQLQTQLAAANQALAAATARQQDRDAKLGDVLTTIATEKQSATTPDQLLAGIAREARLPTVPTLQPAPLAGPDQSHSSALANSKGNSASRNPLQEAAIPDEQPAPSADLPSAPSAQIPVADLKPLYDYILDCKACQAKLTAAQSDLADEKTKTATLTKSRDEALKAAQGGSILQRTVRALKWFALGAAAGAVAAKSAHH
jgi:hypothetical protein